MLLSWDHQRDRQGYQTMQLKSVVKTGSHIILKVYEPRPSIGNKHFR